MKRPLSEKRARCVRRHDDPVCIASSHAPCGAESLASLYAHPEWIYNKLCEGECAMAKNRFERLQTLCQRFKIRLHEFYAGKGTAATVTTHWNQKLRSVGLIPKGQEFFTTTMAADLYGPAQACLLSHKHPKEEEATIKHVFQDFVQDRVNELDSFLMKLLPDDRMAEPYETQCAWEKMGCYMMADPTRFLADKAWCTRCLQPCLIDSKLETHPDGTVLSGFEEIVAVSAGTTCVDFAYYGHGAGESGESMLALNTTCAHCVKYQPKFLFFEIAGKDVSVKLYEKRLGHLYSFCAAWLSPTFFGGPASRPRLYTFGWHCTCKYFGSVQEFNQLFGVKLHMDARVYFADTMVQRYRESVARSKVYGFCYPSSSSLITDGITIPSIPLEHQFTSMTFQRWTAFGERLLEQMIKKQKCEKPNVYLVDVDQSSEWSGGGECAPCLVKHGTLVDVISHQVATSKEHLLIQGEATTFQGDDEGWDDDYACCILPAVNKLAQTTDGRRALKHLAGNSQVSYVLSAWMMYNLSNVEVFVVFE